MDSEVFSDYGIGGAKKNATEKDIVEETKEIVTELKTKKESQSGKIEKNTLILKLLEKIWRYVKSTDIKFTKLDSDIIQLSKICTTTSDDFTKFANTEVAELEDKLTVCETNTDILKQEEVGRLSQDTSKIIDDLEKELSKELSSNIKEVKTEIKGVKIEFKSDLNSLKIDLNKMSTNIAKLFTYMSYKNKGQPIKMTGGYNSNKELQINLRKIKETSESMSESIFNGSMA